MPDHARILNALLAARHEIDRLRSGEGNPNHASDGKFASSGGGGKHAARQARRKAKLESLRRHYHREAKDLKRHHAADRKEMVRDHRNDLKGLRKGHAGEKREMARDHDRELARLGREHARELKREPEADHEAIRESHATTVADTVAGHKGERRDLRTAHRDEVKHIRRLCRQRTIQYAR